MPDILPAPTSVTQSVNKDGNIAVNWKAAPVAAGASGPAGYEVQVLDLPSGAAPPVPVVVSDPNATTATITSDLAWPVGWKDVYRAQVRALSTPAEPTTDPLASPWQGAFLWRVSPSLTITIDTTDITLTEIPDAEGTHTFTLITGPPITVDVAALTKYISDTTGLPLPSIPGMPTGDTLTIDRFTISTSGFFDLGLTYNLAGGAGWTPFTGFTVKSIGVAVLHSDSA